MKCSICGKEHKEDEMTNYSLSQWDGFCHSGDSISLCKKCKDENMIFTDEGIFLTYNGYLYYYSPCCFTRINSQHEIDMIFNKDYITITNIFQNQNKERQMKRYEI